MKTKHILTALALPALLAACNNDEFESMNFEQAQSERPLLSEDFVLKMGFEGADTRYAVEGDGSLDFKFTDGDQLGAAIIDEYKPDESDIAKWPVIYSLAGNNPFTYNANADEWKSATRLGIGHYLYVYPYSPEDNNRAAVSYSLPTIQELYQTEDGAVDLNAAIEKGNKAVYSNILDEDNQTLEASLKNLYAYPKFVINFDNGQNVTSVSKVVLEYDNGEGFAVKGGFNHKDVAELFADPKTDWNKVQTADLVIDDNDDPEAANYTTIDYSKYLIAKLPKNAKVQTNSVTNNKYIEVRFMMPSAKMTYSGNAYTGGDYEGKLNMYIYTNNGVYWINDVVNNIVFKDTTPAELKERVFARTTSFTLNMSTLTSANKKEDNLNIVTNVEDWNNLVSAYGSFEKFTATAPLKVAVVGEDFTLNASAKMPSKAIFEITTEVKVEGEVTLSNVKVTNTVTVEEHATLTTSGSFTAKKVENNGTMNIAVVTNKDGDVVPYSGVGKIENNGTLNIAKDAKATFALKNTKGAVVTNNGEITISGDNSGEINNKAVFYVDVDGFTNNKQAKENDPMPTIDNAADARIMAKDGDLDNNALIVNKGSITCKNMGGEITNAGVLDSQETALTYITDNEKGKIIVYSENTTNLTIGNRGKEGIVEYTTDKTSVDFTNSLVNTVIASKDLTVTGKTLSSLTFEKTAALTLGKNGRVNVLNVNGGITTVKSNMDVYTLNVAKGAQITVPEGITLTVNGSSIDNQGRILVGGTFNATNIQSGATGVGTVEDNGNGKINWAKTPVKEAEEKYEAALTKMVQAWIVDSNRQTWADVEKIDEGQWTTANSATSLASAKTWVQLLNEAKDAYNTWKKAKDEKFVNLNNNQYFEVFKNDTKVDEIINTYKTYGNSNRGAAIKEKYTDNTWVGTIVYVQSASTTKIGDIVKKEASDKMVDAFATKIQEISNVSISISTDADIKNTENKAIKLSLKAVTGETVAASWVPAYSYIETYETAKVYQAIKMWKEASAKYVNDNWYKNGAITYGFDANDTTYDTMKRMKSFYNEINKVDTTGDLLLGQELKPLKNIVETVVLEWNYTNEQIQYLSSIIAAL